MVAKKTETAEKEVKTAAKKTATKTTTAKTPAAKKVAAKTTEKKVEVKKLETKKVEAKAEVVAETKVESLAELKKVVTSTPKSDEPRKPNRDKFGRSYATGKRKNSVARVWVKPGKGNVTINDKDIDTYFARPVLKMIINQPFEITNRENEFDVICTVKGGGLSGQAGAIKHGISKALNEYDPELRAVLKKAGFLTRDARIVERKKFGRAKARRSYQFSKR